MAQTVTVRPLEAGDREAWERMFRAYHTFYQTVVPDDVYPVTFARLLSDEPGTHVGFMALTPAGQSIGFTHALYHRSTWVKTGHVYLQDLFVEPDVRGTGAGRVLIEAVYSYADELGAARTYWLTHEDNAPARALYDKVAARSGFIQYRR